MMTGTSARRGALRACVALAAALALLAPRMAWAQGMPAPAALCEAAIRTAEQRYDLPPNLLTSVSLVETGRPDAGTGRLRPWPWSVQANSVGHYFATKAEAIDWVRNAQAQGIASVDVGCLQVNLYFHAQAFETLEAAFDPATNVDYAARFLTRLHAETSDWVQSIGFYHSRTPALAAVYQQQVQQFMGSKLPAVRVVQRVPGPVERLSAAWHVTLGEPLAAPAGAPQGRSWDSLLLAPAPKPRQKAKLVFAFSEQGVSTR
jgi:hypothetical protein